MSRVLVIGDVHAPVTHPGYLDFCSDIAEQWACDRIHFIGDIVDWHAISFHARHPEATGVMDEYEAAKAMIKQWETRFPEASVSIGNHDARVFRLAESVNIPAFLVRDYNQTWETHKWAWEDETIIDDVYYFHGTGYGGIHPAYNAAKTMGMSVVMGHVHHAGGIKWMTNPLRRTFGMDTGCGVDSESAAMAYGKAFRNRPTLGCGVVLDGIPFYEIMPASPGEDYHRSRFTGRGS